MSRPLFDKPLYSRRTAQRERVEILTAQDTSGDETWEDLQDHLDRVLTMVTPIEPMTIAEYKERMSDRTEMKLPVICPHCWEVLELEYVDHQHLSCHGCGCEFCFICIKPLSGDERAELHRSVHEYQRRARSAMMN